MISPSVQCFDNKEKAISPSQFVAIEPSLSSTTKPPFPQSVRLDSPKHSSIGLVIEEINPDPVTEFRLYKRRFAGVVGLFLLNVAGGMASQWFGPIANETADTFQLSLTRVNWLSNVIGIIYLPTALLMPSATSRYGLRRSCQIGAVFLLLASWLRYAGTVKPLSNDSTYALLFIGQIFAGIAQPIFQILGPVYSELWFDTGGRQSATTFLTIANLIGAAAGQIISPATGDPRDAILILAIISSVIAPTCFLIQSRPPTPPTYAGSVKSPPMTSFLRAWVGMRCVPESYMSVRERIDFALIAYMFTILFGVTSTFSVLTNEYLRPYGYDDKTSGLFGAVLLLAGLLAAICSALLFDRVLTHHLSLTIRICCPVIGAAWIALIWAVKRDNNGALFALFAIIGALTVPLFPIGVELAVNVTRNADAASAILYCAGSAFGVISLTVEDALRLGSDADPPNSMKNALIFQAVAVGSVIPAALMIQGSQMRRERDQQAAAQNMRLPLSRLSMTQG